MIDVTAGGTYNYNYGGNAGVLIVGETGTGVLNVRGGLVTINPANTVYGLLVTGVENTSTATGIVNLTAGTLSTPVITSGGASGTSIFNFNGGTLQASASTTAFMTGLTQANVFAGGATINTGTNSVTIAQPLLAPTGKGVSNITLASGGSGYQADPLVLLSGGGGTGASAIATEVNGIVTGITVVNPGTGYTSAPTVTLVAGSNAGYSGATGASATATVTTNAITGGLTKFGAGTLTLTGSNSYGGATNISAGTLLVNGSVGGSITLAAGAALGGTGTVGAIVVNGTLAAGPSSTAIGTFTTGGETWNSGGALTVGTSTSGGVTTTDRLILSSVTNAATHLSPFLISVSGTGIQPGPYVIATDTGTTYAANQNPFVFSSLELEVNGVLNPFGYTLTEQSDTSGYVGDVDLVFTAVAPEPASALLLAAFAPLALGRRRRRR